MNEAFKMRKPHILFLTLLLTSILLFSTQSMAQSVIRDSEIEGYFNEWFTPIFTANNMNPSQVKIIIVQDDGINAFVTGGSNIFFYTGLIEKTDNPGELIGVMAHELGHISGGHLIRGQEALEQASYESILGTIIGVGAAVATGNSSAAGAGSIAANSVATRRFLAKTRTFESSADQAALKSMNKAEMNPKDFLTFMKKLEGEELLPGTQQSEYVRSHPLTRNRISLIEKNVETSPHNQKKTPPQWQDQHARMKAKLIAYQHPERVSWLYNDTDKSIPALYARSIAAYRTNKINEALTTINQLIQIEPQNPFFYELKGQMLVEFGRVKEGIKPLQKSVLLSPNDGLFRTALAHAQIETAEQDPSLLNQAIKNLKIARQAEPRSSKVHRLFATAYGRQGNDPLARLHLAEEALLQNNKNYAKQQAEIALKGLPANSASALRANDILLFASKRK